MQIHDKEELDLQKTIAEIRKLNKETELFTKKTNYFEIILIIAAFAAGGAFVKYFAG